MHPEKCGRLLGKSALVRRHADFDPLLHRIASDSLADNVEWKILQLSETNTALPHVEPLAGRLVFLAKLRFRISVNAHHIDRHVIFLGGEADVGERFVLSIEIPGRKYLERHDVA